MSLSIAVEKASAKVNTTKKPNTKTPKSMMNLVPKLLTKNTRSLFTS